MAMSRRSHKTYACKYINMHTFVRLRSLVLTFICSIESPKRENRRNKNQSFANSYAKLGIQHGNTYVESVSGTQELQFSLLIGISFQFSILAETVTDYSSQFLNRIFFFIFCDNFMQLIRDLFTSWLSWPQLFHFAIGWFRQLHVDYCSSLIHVFRRNSVINQCIVWITLPKTN